MYINIRTIDSVFGFQPLASLNLPNLSGSGLIPPLKNRTQIVEATSQAK